MNKKLLWIIIVVILLGIVSVLYDSERPKETAQTSPSPSAGKLSVSHNLWPGYYPITIAKEMGFFKDEGIEVTTHFSEDQLPTVSEFYAKKYDVLALPLGSIVSASGKYPDADVRVVYAIDDSVGGDAVVARAGIESVADLKGKSIGTALDGFGEVFVIEMLKSAGLTSDDVTLINADANQVYERIKAGEIDAGHTWEPYISRAVKAGGKVIFTSKQTPGLIVDVISFQGKIVDERPEDVKAFVRACDRAIEYWLANPEKTKALLMKSLNISEDDIFLDGIKLLTVQDNQQVFDKNYENSVYKNADIYSEFYLNNGTLSRKPDTSKMISSVILTTDK
ncbi:ABC transporter substrate-binding protein [Vibrio sp. S4M6]|uniref:ABC transporter substrate-binding protein n=1 Tax=Vibrio sinus TaxID=2946865 RepID=UPI00202A8076|nr:ABC transporter substrate-binding protein [Vibrio sinus]MCL9780003.1 ABC transporter substrate-binding protein [Vibrio sinus]